MPKRKQDLSTLKTGLTAIIPVLTGLAGSRPKVFRMLYPTVNALKVTKTYLIVLRQYDII